MSVLIAGVTAGVLVIIGLAIGPFGVEPDVEATAPFGPWTLAWLALAADFPQTFVGVSACQRYGWAHSPGVALHLPWTVAFGPAVAVLGVAIVPLVLCATDGVATGGLFTAGEAFDTPCTDTGEKHATDIGTGRR